MDQDFVFWGVIACLVGTVAVIGWLFYKIYSNAINKDQSK